MKLIKLLTITLLTTSCTSLIPPQKHEVRLIEDIKKNNFRQKTRQEKYYECIVKLHREGINQRLIQDLCDATYGSILI